MRCPASLRHAFLAESLGKPSLWVIISGPWYKNLFPRSFEVLSLAHLLHQLFRQGRDVTFQLAQVAVPRELFRKILSMIDDLRPSAAPA